MMQPQINHATGLHHVLPGNDTENDLIGGYAFDSYLQIEGFNRGPSDIEHL